MILVMLEAKMTELFTFLYQQAKKALLTINPVKYFGRFIIVFGIKKKIKSLMKNV